MAVYLLISIISILIWNTNLYSQSGNTYKVETLDGVRHIHNDKPTWGNEQKISLEFIQKIGELDGTDENYLLHFPFDVAEDSKGNIYILEYGNKRLQKFGPKGKYISTIGNEGQGPGEFGMPIRLEIDENDFIYVTELRAKMQVFSPDGMYYDTAQLPSHSPLFKLQKSGNIVYINEDVNYEKRSVILEKNLLGVINKKGEKLFEFGKRKDYGNIQLSRKGNSLDFIVDKDDNIIVNFHHQNRIEKYSSTGNLIFKMDRPIDYDIKIYEEKINVPGIGEVTSQKITSVNYGIGIDSKGRIWELFIKRQKNKGDKLHKYTEFNVYSDNGILLTKIPIPDKDFTNIENLEIIGNRIYFITPMQEESVYVYKIIEK